MIRATIKFFSICNAFPITNHISQSNMRLSNRFFSSHKNDKYENSDHHEKKQKYEHQMTKKDERYFHQHEQKHPTRARHQHGPGCRHNFGHRHHPSHHHNHPTHQGAAANYVGHTQPADAKLSQLSFEELIHMRSQDSLKYAHLIYQQQERKLINLQEQKQQLLKTIQLYDKIDEEIKEKENKLEENIGIYEQQAALSAKRAQKQVEESKSFALTKIAQEFLEVADCIASCKKFAEQAVPKDKFLKLIIHTQQLIRDILKKYSIEEFNPINQQYNPDFQESLLQIPTPQGCTQGHVAVVMRTGYTIRGRLLRSARVGVFS